MVLHARGRSQLDSARDRFRQMSLSLASLFRPSHHGESTDTTETTYSEIVESTPEGWPVLVDSVAIVSSILQRSSFILAIILPFVYLPILASGFPTTDSLVLSAGLIGLHIVCLVVGHNYPSRQASGATRQ